MTKDRILDAQKIIEKCIYDVKARKNIIERFPGIDHEFFRKSK